MLLEFSQALVVITGMKLSSQEGMTQGDPLGMALYSMGLTLLEKMSNTKINATALLSPPNKVMK